MTRESTDVVIVYPKWSRIIDSDEFARFRYPRVRRGLQRQLNRRVVEICQDCELFGVCQPLIRGQNLLFDAEIIGLHSTTTNLKCNQIARRPIILNPKIIEHNPTQE